MKIPELGPKWFDAYENCLRHYQVKKAVAISRYYQPKKLYKYISFASSHWRENVFDGQIAFSLPSEFNDPFDSRWFLDYEKIIKSRFQREGETCPVELLNEESFQNYINLSEEDTLYIRYAYCLTCFSSTPHSNLMWGHYANKHKGVCLEYDLSRLPNSMKLIMPVVYTDKPFDATELWDMDRVDDQYAVLCPLLFKSADWSYEKEWRAIIRNKNYVTPYIEKTKNAITGIYYGFRAFGKERTEIEEWAKKNEIQTYQLERTYMSYDFLSEPMEDLRLNNSSKGLLI